MGFNLSGQNIQHDELFGQYLCGIEQTCRINQSFGQFCTLEETKTLTKQFNKSSLFKSVKCTK